MPSYADACAHLCKESMHLRGIAMIQTLIQSLSDPLPVLHYTQVRQSMQRECNYAWISS